MVMSHKTNYII